ncbi:MAG TPA: hypothetical protein VJ302_26465 [Blastocatellia bacterium]|nr:hypothetical protein [Blastocatellia bacterium]
MNHYLDKWKIFLRESGGENPEQGIVMKIINAEGDGAELPDFNGITDEPDMTIYEITIKVMFYESPNREVIDYLELSAEDVVMMFQQFKAGGYLPANCRIILNTALVKEFLSAKLRS